MNRFAPYVIAALALGLSACTNPYDPVQRGLGGGVLGAASGAAIGAAAGGGPGAALGAAIGGATGIFGGVATTPPPPPGTYYGYPAYGYGYPRGYGYPAYRYPAYGYPGYGYPVYPQPGYGYPGYSGGPGYLAPPAYGYDGDAGYPDYPGSLSYEYHGDARNPAYPGSSGYGSSGDIGHPNYPSSPSYEYHGDAEYPAHPGPPGYGSAGDAGPPPYPGSPSFELQSRPLYPPEAGSGFGYPEYRYPGDHASKDWSPGDAYGVGPNPRTLGSTHFGHVAATLLEAVIMLIAMVVAARWVIRRFAVPQTTPATTRIGLVALGLLIPAEIAGVVFARGLSLHDYFARFLTVPGVISLVRFLLFAAMPALVTLVIFRHLERSSDPHIGSHS